MSLRTKVLLPLALFGAVFLAYLYGYWMPRSLANIESGHRDAIERHLDSVDEALIPLLLGHQLDAVYENLDSLMKKNRDWIELRLLDAGGKMLYPLTLPTAAQSGPAGKDVHVIERRIVYLEKDLGRLVLKVDFGPRLTPLRKRHWEMMLVTLACIIMFVATMGIVLDRIVMRPVKLLSHASRRLAENDFTVPLRKVGEDEVGVLVEDFEGMRSAIQLYRAHFQDAHASVQRELAERRTAEEALRKSEEKYRMIVDTATEGIWMFGPDTLTTFVNARMAAMLGYESCELIGRPMTDFLIPEDIADHECKMAARRRGIAENYERRFRRKDGKTVWTHASATPLIDDEQKYHGSFGMFTDITERRNAEEQLRKSNAIVERIFAMTTTCIAYMDRDFNFIRVNHEYAAADEKEPEYFIGKNHFALYPNADNEAVFRKVVETGEEYRVHAKPFEYRNHPERGVSHWDWSLTPVKDPAGKVEALILSLINVTERIAAQEELNTLNAELEERISKRTAELEEKNRELERMNRLFIGRELKMVELKERIAELEKRQGRTDPA